MTGRTLTRQASVIHRRWLESRVILVAGIALCRGRNMADRRFPEGIDTIMTSRAGSGCDAGMVKDGRLPGRRAMTDFAGLLRLDVGYRLGLGIDPVKGTAVAGST